MKEFRVGETRLLLCTDLAIAGHDSSVRTLSYLLLHIAV